MFIFVTKIRECHVKVLITSKYSPRSNNVSVYSAETSYCGRGGNQGSLGRIVSIKTTARLSVFISQPNLT